LLGYLGRGRWAAVNILFNFLVDQVGSNKQEDDAQYHDDEQQEIPQVEGVVRLIGDGFYDLAELAFEALATVALAVHAHTTVHALPRAVFDLSIQNLDVGAHVLLSAELGVPLHLEGAGVAAEILRKLNFFAFDHILNAAARELS